MVPGMKHELETKVEKTEQARFYKPAADIIETEHELTLYLDMPGVAKSGVEVKLDQDQLTLEGKIDFARYESLKAVYAEYNVGHFRRSFQLSSAIDQKRISAKMEAGTLVLTLPKAEEAKPRTIQIS